MSTFLPKEVLAGIDAARAKDKRRKTKLRVETGDAYFPVLRMWDNGFAMDAEDAPKLRGLIDLFDGPRHLYQALIVASSEESGERHFEFKRNTEARDRAPLDFARETPEAVALLGR